MNSVFNLTGKLLPALLAAGVLGIPAAEAGETGTRVATTREIPAGGRDGQRGEAVQHVHAALVSAGTREPRGSAATGDGAAATSKAGNDVWFYAADVVLFNDDDNDGYYWGIDLLFDADSYYDAIDVYAVGFLSYEGGPWNEYVVTGDFTINGATSDDEYVIVTELESGYPTGDYDLLIELYDAVDGSFLAEFGPADTSELAFLPLEDFQRDAPPDTVVVVGHSHGGGAAFWLLPLAILPLRRALSRCRRGLFA